MDKLTTEIDGTVLAFGRCGSGPVPVVVMHGWGCNSDTMAIPAQAACGPGTTVYNLDLPGFGASPEPATTWGITDYADLVEKFCQRFGLERPVLIGHSFGGRIAIILASRMPVGKLILIDAAGIKPRRSLRYYIKVYGFKAAKRLALLFLGKERGGRVVDRWRAKAGSSDYAGASPRMRAIMSRVVNEDLRHLLPEIKAPTLLIWGERDTATPIADARLMERLIPDAGLVSYPEAGHFSFLDRPAQTRAVIDNFING